MPSLTLFRLLKEHSGDTMAALEHACRTIDHLASQVSVGLMRAGLPTEHVPKPRLVALDVDRQDSPNG